MTSLSTASLCHYAPTVAAITWKILRDTDKHVIVASDTSMPKISLASVLSLINTRTT